jgi:hypothetical protein
MATDIYKGAWIDWSKGRVQGATITLSRQSGGVLSVFIALYVAFAGTMFWKLCSYILHQLSSSQKEKNTVHHQRQVILRNTGNIAATWAFFSLPFRHKKNFRRAVFAFLPYAAFALFCFIGFTLAGLFSSRITTAIGPYVLARGEFCGSWTIPDALTTVTKGAFVKSVADTMEADNYVRQCYENNGTAKDSACAIFIRPTLPFSINANAKCPFDETVCNGTAFEMDTGKLDSQLHFGLNAPPKDRIEIRRVTTCTRTKNVPATIVNETGFGSTLYYNAGPLPGMRVNYTFRYYGEQRRFSSAYYLE